MACLAFKVQVKELAMRVLITYDYGEKVFEAIRQLGYDLTYIPEQDLTPEDDLSDVQVLICYNPFQNINLQGLKALRVIMLSSIGVDQVPQALRQGEMIVTNNQGGYSPPMGEWIVMHLLMGLKKTRLLMNQQAAHQWQINTQVKELTRLNVGFLGTGTIAREAVKRLVGFEAHLIGFNSNGRTIPGFDRTYPLTSLEDHAPTLDALVVCLPATQETRGCVSESVLRLMKDDAILINVSRGQVMDEEALMAHLIRGKFSWCALDVFTEEPLSKDSPLWDLPQVAITPHNSWVSQFRNERRLTVILENLRRLIKNEPLTHIVDMKRGY